ncbi:MAG: hypothetical protein NW217_15405 [Hyphomicrobiaceae bacterium]|nr:hypothetical protein [Hyphomicrobiaceae bacterium]
MSQRVLLVVIAAAVLLLSASQMMRTHWANADCLRKGLIWHPAQGCIPDPSKVEISRDLKRV